MKAKAAPMFITVAAAAAELEVSPATVRRWSNEGHFPIFQPPSTGKARVAGPKLLRINRGDWRRFVENHTKVAVGPAATEPAPKPRPREEEARGPDGINRRRGR